MLVARTSAKVPRNGIQVWVCPPRLTNLGWEVIIPKDEFVIIIIFVLQKITEAIPIRNNEKGKRKKGEKEILTRSEASEGLDY